MLGRLSVQRDQHKRQSPHPRKLQSSSVGIEAPIRKPDKTASAKLMPQDIAGAFSSAIFVRVISMHRLLLACNVQPHRCTLHVAGCTLNTQRAPCNVNLATTSGVLSPPLCATMLREVRRVAGSVQPFAHRRVGRRRAPRPARARAPAPQGIPAP